MGQIIRCPLIGVSCSKPITIEEKSFFLAEAEKPEPNRKRRITAINTALGNKYELKSALDEKGINAFTCKICELIQVCAYGIADITDNNPNVLLELGMMIALGKPTIILLRRDQEMGLNLPSDLNAIEVIPFTEYIDIIDQFKKVVKKLPPPVSPPNPIQDLEKIQPKFATELKKIGDKVVKEFKKRIVEAKLDAITLGEGKKEVPPQLDKRLRSLEEKLEDLRGLGFATDADTASSRAYYFYNRGEYEEALASLNWLAELRPDDPDTFSNRGLAYYKLGRHEESLADYNRSLELRPDYPATLTNRGIAYGEMGKHKEALANLNRSLELRPDHPGTLYNLACLFSLWGKTGNALPYLEKAIGGDEKYREKAKTDEDFNNIREDARFKKLIESD